MPQNICVFSARQADAFTKFHQLRSTPLPKVTPAPRGSILPAQQALAFRLEAEREAQLEALAAIFDCRGRTHAHISRREAEQLLAAQSSLVSKFGDWSRGRAARLRIPSPEILHIIRAGDHPVCVLQTSDLPDYNLGTLDCSRHKHLTRAAADELLCTCCSPLEHNARIRENPSKSEFPCLQKMRAGSPYGAPLASRISPRHILMIVDYGWRPVASRDHGWENRCPHCATPAPIGTRAVCRSCYREALRAARSFCAQKGSPSNCSEDAPCRGCITIAALAAPVVESPVFHLPGTTTLQWAPL